MRIIEGEINVRERAFSTNQLPRNFTKSYPLQLPSCLMPQWCPSIDTVGKNILRPPAKSVSDVVTRKQILQGALCV